MQRRVALTLLSALSWAVGTWIALQVAMGVLVTLVPSAGTDIVSLGAVHILVLGGACYLLVWASERTVFESADWDQWARVLGLHSPRPMALLLGVGVGVSAKLPADGLRAFVEHYYPTDELELVQQMQLLRHDTVGQVVALFVVVGFTGPLLEELFYRGLLFRTLERRVSLLMAWLVTSLVFALAHPSVRDWPSLILVALAFGFLRGVFGTLWASLAAHVAFNSATLAALVIGAQQVDASASFPVAPALVGAGLVLALLLVARRFYDPGT